MKEREEEKKREGKRREKKGKGRKKERKPCATSPTPS